MDFGYGGNWSADDEESFVSRKGKRPCLRDTAHEIQQLEEFFDESPAPDENQRSQSSQELCWDPNKRSQTKAQNEQYNNNTLQAENERIQYENLALREVLKNVNCTASGGSPFEEEEQWHSLEKLKMQNGLLKLENERLSNLVSKFLRKPVTQIESLSPTPTSSFDFPAESSTPDQEMDDPSHDFDAVLGNPMLAHKLNGIQDMEKSLIVETAARARAEMIRLLQANEPLWIKSPMAGVYVLNREIYDELFSRVNHLKSSSARTESSKYFGPVKIAGRHLVDMFLDSDKWMNLFPSIVKKASTIEVLDTGMFGNQGDFLQLQLMDEQIHILSPLVAPREFLFLRLCQQLGPGLWVVVDVSYDRSGDKIQTSPSRSWRLPSGCLIRDMPNGYSSVIWVEHVEVDDKSPTHLLFRDLVCNSLAYGAPRWLITLQRMCERSTHLAREATLLQGVSRNTMMILSHRMVKNFCSNLFMSRILDIPQLSELTSNGVRFCVRKTNKLGQPNAIFLNVATSLWRPISCETLFNFFRDEKTRPQWDVQCNGNPVHRIATISTGTHPGNLVSVIGTFVSRERKTMMLQESWIDPLGSLIVYAPIDFAVIKSAIRAEKTPILLPSGFVISGDGRSDKGAGASTSAGSSVSGGSLLTVVFHIQVDQRNSIAVVKALVCSTIQKIKAALNSSYFG